MDTMKVHREAKREASKILHGHAAVKAEYNLREMLNVWRRIFF